jgi:hypothetical protein
LLGPIYLIVMLSFLTEYLKIEKIPSKCDFVNIESFLMYKVSLELSELIQVPLTDERIELALEELSNSTFSQPTTRIKNNVMAIRFFIIKDLGYNIRCKYCASLNTLLQLTARRLRKETLPAHHIRLSALVVAME